MNLKGALESDVNGVLSALRDVINNIAEAPTTDEYMSLLSNLREYYVTHDSSMYDLSVLNNQECENLLIEAIKATVQIFDQFLEIRKSSLPVTDQCDVLKTLFKHGVLHMDYKFIYGYSEKPFDTFPCNVFVNAYAQLIYDCIEKLFWGETLRDALKFNTGLRDELIACIADQVEENFEALKLNRLILNHS